MCRLTLVCGGVEEVGVIFEEGLRAIAVMHVPVYHTAHSKEKS